MLPLDSGNQWRDKILYLCLLQTNPIVIPNSDRRMLARLFWQLGFTVGAEVGVGSGVYSEMLCRENPGVKLYCVDMWQIYDSYVDITNPGQLTQDYETCLERMKPYDATIIRDWSMKAVKSFDNDSLDFVYIDANHDSPYIDDDIREWSKKVKPGGIVSGHDYMNGHKDVMRAVDIYTFEHGIQSWYLVGKPQETGDPLIIPSWFWVKP